MLRDIEMNDGFQAPPKQKKSRKIKSTEAPKMEDSVSPTPPEPTASTSEKPSRINSSSFY